MARTFHQKPFRLKVSVKSSDSELVTHKLFSMRICINRFAMIGNRIDCRDMLRLNSLEGDRRNVIIALNLSECYRGCSFNRLGRSLAVFEIGLAAGQFAAGEFSMRTSSALRTVFLKIFFCKNRMNTELFHAFAFD